MHTRITEPEIQLPIITEPHIERTQIPRPHIVITHIPRPHIETPPTPQPQIPHPTIPETHIPITDIAGPHIGTPEIGQPRNQGAGAARRVCHCRLSGRDERRKGCRRLLQQLGEGRQCRHRRGGFGVIAEHGGDVLRPHLFVLGIHRRDRRGVQAEQVRCHERHQLRAVCQHRARIDRRRQGGLERGGRHASLPGSLPGLRTRRREPTQIVAGHFDHRRRRRPLP